MKLISLIILIFLLSCIFDEKSNPAPPPDTRNDHDQRLIGRWHSVTGYESVGRREIFDGTKIEHSLCIGDNSSGSCSKSVTWYRTFNDTMFYDSSYGVNCYTDWVGCRYTDTLRLKNKSVYKIKNDTLHYLYTLNKYYKASDSADIE